MRGSPHNLLGKTFGRLTVIAKGKTTKSGNWCWKCRCSCGKIRIVRSWLLRSGKTKSCGCWKKEWKKLSLRTIQLRESPRICRKCKLKKSAKEFASIFNLVCRECWRSHSRKNRYKYLYGLTNKALHSFSFSKCAICGINFSKKMRRMLDHDHITNTPRNFLCHSCNAILGFSKESPKILNAAIKYLARF